MSRRKTKSRFNVAIDPRVKAAGSRLAKAQNRTFSNLVETLLIREGERIQADQKEAA